MVVWPGVVVYSIVDFFVRVAGAFCAKFPYCPLVAVFVVEELDELVGWVAVGTLWVGG